MRRLPPLQALLAFDAAARVGSFTRAAQELALTQSAISHQIQQLEEWTGQPLFRRIGRGVALTAAGVLYAQTVSTALATLADGRDRIEPYGNPDSVILVCAPQFASGWLMPRMRQFAEALPTLEIWLVTDEEVNEIDRVDVDLVVSARPIRTPEVACELLLDEEAVAICGPETAGRLRDAPFPEVLTQAPLLVHEARPEWAPWLPELRRGGLRTRRALTVSDPRFVVAAARTGGGHRDGVAAHGGRRVDERTRGSLAAGAGLRVGAALADALGAAGAFGRSRRRACVDDRAVQACRFIETIRSAGST
ncbi:LysR family transcriptional regulator [Paraburkholderia bryophila]|uniref:LysR family glycine cleavage system transcriptional activator n=1 Tax=Paraburkholderia bryophila TaxID=420952 RepID=A0A7Y9WB95_9BURK|nr:LysR family transcriptional regulator [Paraburkholderia bryophila]NYH16808.1 LysR family glycine cleavage system transcriptional activator [Paraburkholderia bryophila]